MTIDGVVADYIRNFRGRAEANRSWYKSMSKPFEA